MKVKLSFDGKVEVVEAASTIQAVSQLLRRLNTKVLPVIKAEKYAPNS